MRRIAVVLIICCSVSLNAGIFSWTTGGPLGGTVRAIVFDPKTPGVVYAGTAGGVFKSTNGGQTWQRMNTGLDVSYVLGLAIDATNPATLAAAVLRSPAVPGAGGVFITTNGGATWQQKTAGMTALTGSSIAIDPIHSVMYAGTFSGMFRSANGGASWTPINNGLANTFIDSIAIDPILSKRIYAGTNAGFFASDDAGTTWLSSTTGMTGVPVAQAIAVDSQNPDVLYSAANFSSTPMYKSIDRGATWSPFANGIPNQAFGAIYDIDAGPAGVFAAMIGIGIFQNGTTTTGSQWFNNTNGLSAPFNCFAVAADPFFPRVLGSDEGVLANVSVITGAPWVPLNNGLTAHPINTVAVDPTNPRTVYAGSNDRGFYMSTDGGVTWSPNNGGFNPGVVFSIAVDPQNPSTLYAGTGMDVVKSVNGGQTWTQSSVGMLPAFLDYVYNVTIDPNNSNVIYAGRADGMYKSVNGAANWMQVNSGISMANIVTGMRSIAVDPRNSSIVYAGAGNGGVYKSTNGGLTWTSITGNLPPNRLAAAIAIDPKESSDVYVAMETNVAVGKGGVFFTRNGGATWSSLTSGMTIVDATSLVFDPIVPATMYVGTRGGGVFVSHNRGLSWAPFNTGNPNMFVSSLAIAKPSAFPALLFVHRQLYAGTEGSVYNISF